MSLNEFGQFTLSLAWILSLYTFCFGIYKGITSKSHNFHLDKALVLVSIFSFIALASLGGLFLIGDFTNQYVWQTSNKTMSNLYKITAIWGGMDGSMLLWASILSIASGIVAFKSKKYPKEIKTWLFVVLASSCFFFLTVTLFYTNPFRYIKVDFIPPDGNGLNPLLQNPYMAIHPPMLYFGFTLFSIPYAFALAALLSGELKGEWLKFVRTWSLIAWSFLTLGITLGGFWAYIELGWGGFWAWDPVENSSFLPWLTATAFIHSLMVQERKGLLKIWNLSLIFLTYALTVFGTFLTRSGIVQSVHAFASTNIGDIFLVYLSIIIIIFIFLLFFRRRKLESTGKLDSFFSREIFILLGNILFVSICFATFWGVMFPVFSEALTGDKQAVGIPFFNTINVPLFLLLALLMSIGPFVSWKESGFKQIKEAFLRPLIVTFLFSILLIFIGGQTFYTFIAYSVAFFAILVIVYNHHRQTRQRQFTTNLSYLNESKEVLKKSRRRYSGLLAHIGFSIAVVAITASMASKVEKEFSLSVGESYKIKNYSIELNDLKEIQTDNYVALKAIASVTKSNNFYTYLEPEFRRYFRNDEVTTEVALKPNIKEDLYLVIAGLDDLGTRATFKLYINPLQVWLWVGVGIILLGAFLAILEQRKR